MLDARNSHRGVRLQRDNFDETNKYVALSCLQEVKHEEEFKSVLDADDEDLVDSILAGQMTYESQGGLLIPLFSAPYMSILNISIFLYYLVLVLCGYRPQYEANVPSWRCIGARESDGFSEYNAELIAYKNNVYFNCPTKVGVIC